MMTNFDEKLANESIVTDEIKVKIYDKVAVVTGRAMLKSRYENQDLSGQYRFTRVYFKRVAWQIVACQATRMPNLIKSLKSLERLFFQIFAVFRVRDIN